jgi:hypothetical protein
VYQEVLDRIEFLALLLRIDEEQAKKVKDRRCSCWGPLHWGSFARKPRAWMESVRVSDRLRPRCRKLFSAAQPRAVTRRARNSCGTVSTHWRNGTPSGSTSAGPRAPAENLPWRHTATSVRHPAQRVAYDARPKRGRDAPVFLTARPARPTIARSYWASRRGPGDCGLLRRSLPRLEPGQILGVCWRWLTPVAALVDRGSTLP